MNHPFDDAGGLTPDQRDKIVELAKLYSRSPRAPEIFLLLAESWVSSRGSDVNTAGFVTRKHLVEQLKDPFSLQALCNLLPQWVNLGLVEVGSGGLRAGPKLRETLNPLGTCFGGVKGQGDAAPSPTHAQPTHVTATPHAAEVLNAIIELFVNYATLLYAMPRSAVYRGLGNWRGSRHELADHLCGIMVDLENGSWPKDPFLALDEMRRGVGNLKPVNAETFAYFKLKQIEAQRAEAAQKAQFDAAVTSAFWDAFGPVMAEFQAKFKAETDAAASRQQSPVTQTEEPSSTLKVVPQGAPQIPEDKSWGQPRPHGSDPAA